MIKLFLDTTDTGVLKSGTNFTPSDTTFIFGELLPDSITNVTVFLESATIPVTVPVFTSSNNRLDFFENLGSTLVSATIPEGNYSGTELAVALQSAMNDSGTNTYSVTYSATTKKLLIGTTIPSTFRILSSSTCLTQLGFESSSLFASAAAASFTVNFLGTRYLDIVVNFPTSSIALNKRNNILARIPLASASGTVFFYQAQIPIKAFVPASYLRTIEVRLYDDTGALYLIDATHQVTYTLIIEPLD